MLRGCFVFVSGRLFLWSLIVLAGVLSINAQQPSPFQPVTTTKVAKANDPVGKKPTGAEKLKRWVEFDALTLSTRYRFIRSNSGQTLTNQDQYQVVARGRFKFDAKGKYSVYAGLFTGNALTSGWNNTGWGTGRDQTNLYLKQLYFDAKPVKWLEVQVGGIGVNNGENTEITGYDNDVYLIGERVYIRHRKNLYFDEVSVTNAFIGDAATPNVFRRIDRLGESNYHQFLVRKQVNKRVGFSADYTFEDGRDTLHQAANVKTPELHIVDRVLFENYQRIDPDPGYGFALFADKKLHDRFTLGGGFARIDRPMLNADRFPPGKRFHLNSTLKLSRELSLNTALIHAVGSLPATSTPRTRLDIILTYNFLETLRRIKTY
jgi:hypothetical protein